MCELSGTRHGRKGVSTENQMTECIGCFSIYGSEQFKALSTDGIKKESVTSIPLPVSVNLQSFRAVGISQIRIKSLFVWGVAFALSSY